MSETKMSGGCGCGAVRYELQSAPIFVTACHCTDCQRLTGSAFALNGVIEADRVKVTAGEVEKVSMFTPAGRPQILFDCPKCHTALWNDYGGKGYIYLLRMGTLDDGNAFAPNAHIFARSKLDWVKLPEDVQAYEEHYDMRQAWPTEALTRRQAASNAAKGLKSD